MFVFRGRRGDIVKLLWWDGQGMCLFAKRLEKGRFVVDPCPLIFRDPTIAQVVGDFLDQGPGCQNCCRVRFFEG